MHKISAMTSERGFTFIELAIIIVIIGLIISGILVSQSMVQSAATTKAVQDINSIKIAVVNFNNSYNCMPGDCARANIMGIGTSGDGTGYLEGSTTETNIKLWQHLYNTRMINISLSSPGVAGIGPQTDVNIPRWKWLDKNSKGTGNNRNGQIYIAHGSACSYVGDNGCEDFQSIITSNWLNENSIVIGNYYYNSTSGGTYRSTTSSPLSSDLAQAIDGKLDDALPRTGKIRGFYSGGIGRSWGTGTSTSCSATSSNLLQTYQMGYTCMLLIDLD